MAPQFCNLNAYNRPQPPPILRTPANVPWTSTNHLQIIFFSPLPSPYPLFVSLFRCKRRSKEIPVWIIDFEDLARAVSKSRTLVTLVRTHFRSFRIYLPPMIYSNDLFITLGKIHEECRSRLG